MMKFNTNKAASQASECAKDFDPGTAKNFAQEHTDKKWYEDFMLLYDMVTDKHFTLSMNVYLSIAGALAYVVLPFDVIPDFIPGVGFIDDIFVIGMVMKSLSDEIERFKVHTGRLS